MLGKHFEQLHKIIRKAWRGQAVPDERKWMFWFICPYTRRMIL
jgi:hypothetical protein